MSPSFFSPSLNEKRDGDTVCTIQIVDINQWFHGKVSVHTTYMVPLVKFDERSKIGGTLRRKIKKYLKLHSREKYQKSTWKYWSQSVGGGACCSNWKGFPHYLIRKFEKYQKEQSGEKYQKVLESTDQWEEEHVAVIEKVITIIRYIHLLFPEHKVQIQI